MRDGCWPANRANIVGRHGYRCFSPFARLPRGARPQVLHRHSHRDAVHRSGWLLADILPRPDLRACDDHHRPRSERDRAPSCTAVHVVAGAVHRADELGRDLPRESASQARLLRGGLRRLCAKRVFESHRISYTWQCCWTTSLEYKVRERNPGGSLGKSDAFCPQCFGGEIQRFAGGRVAWRATWRILQGRVANQTGRTVLCSKNGWHTFISRASCPSLRNRISRCSSALKMNAKIEPTSSTIPLSGPNSVRNAKTTFRFFALA